jgi:hypothetical protein
MEVVSDLILAHDGGYLSDRNSSPPRKASQIAGQLVALNRALAEDRPKSTRAKRANAALVPGLWTFFSNAEFLDLLEFRRHQDGEEMLREIVDLGFKLVELGHGIRLAAHGRRPARAGQRPLHVFRASTIFVRSYRDHPRISDCYKFSSTMSGNASGALRHTVQTIDFARRLGAPFVVLHLGRTPIEDYTDKLIRLAEVGMIHSRNS